jgi:hypothetical protein
MDPDEFRRRLCEELHLKDDASDYEILALVGTAYHFYLLNRPAEAAQPIEALDIPQTAELGDDV